MQSIRRIYLLTIASDRRKLFNLHARADCQLLKVIPRMSYKNEKVAATAPPDGGWGWVVVAAVFVSSGLTYGVSVTYPLFYLPLTQEFQIGLGPAAWLTGAFEAGKAFGCK